MSGKREIACGVDVHNKFILATILSSDGLKLQDRFGTSLDDLLKFKIWLKENGCHKVALASTANSWLPIYHVLERSVNFILANAYPIKHIPGRKTDTLENRTPQGYIFSDSTENFHAIILDLHPPAPTYPPLPSLQLRIDNRCINKYPCRQSFYYCNQTFPVRFTGSFKIQHPSSPKQ